MERDSTDSFIQPVPFFRVTRVVDRGEPAEGGCAVGSGKGARWLPGSAELNKQIATIAVPLIGSLVEATVLLVDNYPILSH